MLEYDEWAVPGEVEYAEKKAAEVEAQLERYHREYEKSYSYGEHTLRLQFTEHVAGIFEIKHPYGIWMDYTVTDEMLMDYFKDIGGSVDEPRIFDLPDDDIRRNLPEWDEAFLTENAIREIMDFHSSRYIVAEEIKHIEDVWGQKDAVKRRFNFSDAQFHDVIEKLEKKLDIENKKVAFTKREEEVADFIKYHSESFCQKNYYDPWYFPLSMTETDIVDIIHKAYQNASKKSRRVIPNKIDFANMRRYAWYSGERNIENYECLYQARVEDMIIRFLFDFKNMKIVTAYPVYKEAKERHSEWWHYIHDAEERRWKRMLDC